MNENLKPKPGVRILRPSKTSEKTGLSRSYLYYLESQGKFPKRIKLGEKASGHIESEVDEWLEKRIAESRSESDQAA